MGYMGTCNSRLSGRSIGANQLIPTISILSFTLMIPGIGGFPLALLEFQYPHSFYAIDYTMGNYMPSLKSHGPNPG